MDAGEKAFYVGDAGQLKIDVTFGHVWGLNTNPYRHQVFVHSYILQEQRDKLDINSQRNRGA